jgi:hypothetical protein
MKPTAILAGISAFSFASVVFADVTVDITGATAFRAATLSAIKAKFDAAAAPYQYSHDQAAGGYTGSTRSIWKGTFQGVSGVTTIRCSFNGSVEGIRALVDSPASDPTYYTDIAGNFITGGSNTGGETHKDTAASQSEIAFSDVSKSSTPYSLSPLQPSSPQCGVVVFTMIGNEGTAAKGISNVTAQQFRALMSKGRQKRSMFTGNPAHTDLVFATGRNDGSGTRTTYLAETGYGVTKTVKQYTTLDSSTTAINTIQLVPAGGVNDPVITGQTVDNASTVWGQDIDGNGGYSSGSLLRTDMGKTSASVTVLDEFGDAAFSGINCLLITWLSLPDAGSARNASATILGYNGQKLTDFAAATSGTAFTAADRALVQQGVYTAWGYQQMYRRNDITSGDVVLVYDGIKNALPAQLDDITKNLGISITSMAVSRPGDGGTVAP